MVWKAKNPGGRADGCSQKGRKWAKFLLPMGYRDGKWIACWPGDTTDPMGFDQAKGHTLPYGGFTIWHLKCLPKWILDYYTRGKPPFQFSPPDKEGRNGNDSFLWPSELWKAFNVLLPSFLPSCINWRIKTNFVIKKMFACLLRAHHISSSSLILKNLWFWTKTFSNSILLNSVSLLKYKNGYICFSHNLTVEKYLRGYQI